MAQEITPEVLIDGAVPRSLADRCDKLLDYYESLENAQADIIEACRDEIRAAREIGGPGFELVQLEDDVIAMINSRLPDNFVCTVGEQEPGDVLIREVGSADEEMK